MKSTVEIAGDLRELRSEYAAAIADLDRAIADLDRAIEILEGRGLIVAAPSASATPEVVRPPASPPARAADGQPKRPRRHFTAEERAEAVALVGSIGRSPAAKKLGIDAPVLDKWRRAAREQTPLSDAPKVSFADRVRAETAEIEQRRKAVAANGDRPKAAMVPSGLPRQPIDHDAVRRNQFPRDDL